MPKTSPKASFLKSALLATALLCSNTVSAQPINLTPSQLEQLAIQALQAGDAATAAFASDALIFRNPNDAGLLLLRTQAAILAQDWSGAIEFGKRAYWASDGGLATFNAARLVARAHAELRNDTISQLWLRRARQYSPNEQSAREVAEDYQFLRNRNPLSFNLRFGLNPSGNINNGSASDTVRLFDLPFDFVLSEDGKALSGWEASVNASARYRLHANATSATFFDVNASGNFYQLSDSSRARVAGIVEDDGSSVEGSDYNTARLSFGLSHRFILSEGAQPIDASLTFARSWLGDEQQGDTWSAQVSQSWIITPRDRLDFNLSARYVGSTLEEITGPDIPLFDENNQPVANATDPVHSNTFGLSWTHALTDGARFDVGVVLNDNRSADHDADYTSAKLALGYTFAQSPFNIGVSVGASHEERDFPQSTFTAAGRYDTLTSANMRLNFRDVEVYGFQPVMNFSWSQQNSNLALFDREYSSVGFDLVSSF